MEQTPDTLARIARKLGSLRPYPPSSVSWGEISQALADFEAVAAGADMRRPEHVGYVSEIAALLTAIAVSTTAAGLIRTCFDFWRSLGPPGWLHLAGFLRRKTVPFSVPQQAISSWKPRDQLLVLNQVFLSPQPYDAGVTRWAKASLATLAGSAQEEPLTFLALLDMNGVPLSLFVKEALLRSGIKPGVLRLLSRPAFEADLYLGLRAARVLAEPGFDDALAALAQRTDNPEAAAAALKVAARIGSARSSGLIKASARALSRPEQPLREAAYDALAALRTAGMERILEFVLIRGGEWGRSFLLDRLPLVEPEAWEAFAARLAGPVRVALEAELLGRIQGLEPAWVAERLEGLASLPGQPLDQALADQVGLHCAGLRSLQVDLTQPESRAPGEWPSVAADPREARKKAEAFAAAVASQKDIRSLSAAGTTIEYGAVSDMSLKWCEFRTTRFVHTSFENVTFTDCDFRDCVFENCMFSNCTVQSSDFSGSRFAEAFWTWCTVTNCNFSLATFAKSHLTQFSATQGDFSMAHFQDSSLSACAFSDCNLSCTIFRGTDIGSTRFSASLMDRLAAAGVLLTGVEFSDCLARDMSLARARLTSCRSEACAMSGLSVFEVESDDPAFLRPILDGRSGIPANLTGLETPGPPPAWTATPAGRAVVRELVRTWYRYRASVRREALFLANNKRRLSMAEERMSMAQQDFLAMLPYMLQTGVFERGKAPAESFPLCRVWGWHPDRRVRELSLRWFEQADIEEPQPDAVLIEGMYLIGSIGTLAQTDSSDLDYWICYDARTATRDVLAGLGRKLALIKSWAEDEFDLEVNFFVMDSEDVRGNNFGFSDEESSGTAQAVLLKEEFYRSALLLQGKRLLWWMLPPGADRRCYEGHRDRLRELGPAVTERVLDLGPVTEMPVEEFFGASLWQIVKAIKNPFKSIMKFGLLQRYMEGQKQQGAFLSERIKENLFDRSLNLLQVDPYAQLFIEVREYYERIGDTPSRELVSLAFLLKSEAMSLSEETMGPYRAHIRRLVEEFFLAREGQGKLGRYQDMCRYSMSSFVRLVKIDNLIRNFILQTYEKVSTAASQDGARVRIDAQDLTKLGRKLFSVFSRRKHKVERIPFVCSMKGVFRDISLATEKAPGRPTTWIALGNQASLSSKRENYSEIRRDSSLMGVIAWIIGNKLYHPKLGLEADITLSPVSTQDLKELAATLCNFFPYAETFDIKPEETLQPERVTRAFMAVNLVQPREVNRLTEISVMYATNWGEMYCLTTQVANTLPRDNPVKFLKGIIPQAVPSRLVIGSFLPRKSRCPALPFRTMASV